MRSIFGAFGAALLACSLASHAVSAAEKCYTPDEMQAEQVLRLHSELMVTTVTCKTDSTGRSLVPFYTGFTKNNLKLIQGAEKTLMAYYEKTASGKPVDRLDKLRTLLANEFGAKIAEDSAPTYCAKRRDKVTALGISAPASILGEVEKTKVEARSYAPACGKNTPSTARKRG